MGGSCDLDQRGCGQKWGLGRLGRAAPLPPSSTEGTLCQGFPPDLNLQWNDRFQQEFSCFQPKCNSKKISLDSLGTQKQGTNG